MMRSDAELVRRTQLGDRDAFGILVERHRARAVGLAMAMLGDFDEAEDVAQEALYQAYFGLDRLRDPARFGGWLCGIAVNLAKMALRRRRMTVSLEDLDGGRVARGFRWEDATPESEFEARELRRSVRRAIEQLPEDMRAAVWMHYVEGLSYREIAAMFGMAPGTLRVQAHRARHKLREALLDEWQEYLWREENTMIEVTVQDVLLWMPKDWEPKPVEGERHYPESPPSKQCVVLLREPEGERALPIWIGPHEGEALTLHLTGIQTLRPLTYDFIVRLLEAGGVTIDRVAVSELRGDTFIATVTIRSGKRTREVDARPSDALNLAVRSGMPIFVEPEVMRTQSIVAADAPRELDEARINRGRVPEEDFVWRSWRDIMLAQKRE